MRYQSEAIQSSVWTIRLALFSVSIVLLAVLFHRILGMGTLVALNLFKLALAGAVIVLALGAFALVRIWQHGWRGGANALVGMVIGCGVLIWPIAVLIFASGHPTINDVTSDLKNPPRFILLDGKRPPGANSMTYPGEKFAAKQRKAYPNLGPLRVERPASETLELARQALRRMHMVVEGVVPIDGQEPGRGQVEAVDRTLIMGFRDDVIVRVTRIRGGALVDIRSSSRFGQSDLGRNALRIAEIQQGLIARIQATVPARTQQRAKEK